MGRQGDETVGEQRSATHTTFSAAKIDLDPEAAVLGRGLFELRRGRIVGASTATTLRRCPRARPMIFAKTLLPYHEDHQDQGESPKRCLHSHAFPLTPDRNAIDRPP